jgi:anaerobic selenocysteine-containing dehydrogenase
MSLIDPMGDDLRQDDLRQDQCERSRRSPLVKLDGMTSSTPASSRSEKVHRSCPICEASCGLVLEIDRDARRVLSVKGDPGDPRSQGYVCPKAVAPVGIYEDPDRLRRPMRRVGPPGPDAQWEEIGWEEALELVGSRLAAIRGEHGHDAVGVYVGNPTGHDFGAMLYTSFFMQALDSHQLYSGATVDQMPKNVSCRQLYGDSWLFPIPDIDRTDFMLILGANPLVSNGSLMSAPNMRGRMRAMRDRGVRIEVVDPRRTETAEECDRHHFIRPGTDAFLLFAMVHVVFEDGLVELRHLAEFSDGLDRLEELAREFSPEAVASATGIAADEIRRLTRDFAAAPRAVCYGRFGTCTQAYGTLASWLVDVLNILTGNFDRPGGLMFPRAATGQTEPVDAPAEPMAFGDYHSRVRGVPSIDGQLPVAVMAEEIEGDDEDRVRAMITVAGNPVLSTPNGERLERALANLEFMVSIDIYLNETTRMADIILPTTVALEHDNYDFLFATTSVRNMARYSPEVFAPEADSKHHWELLLEVAARMNGVSMDTLDGMMFEGMLASFVGKPGTPSEGVDLADAREKLGAERGPGRLLDLMLRAGPWGDGFDADADGLSLARLAEIPHALDLGPLEPRLPELLRTPDRRLPLVTDLLARDVGRLRAALAEEDGTGLVLIGRRQMRNMNSWLHNVESLAKGPARCTLLIHPEDAARAGLEHGAVARVRSRVGQVEVEVELDEGIMPGVVSLPHGYGHRSAGTRLRVAQDRQPGVNSNVLADELLIDPISGTSVLSGIPVEVELGDA